MPSMKRQKVGRSPILGNPHLSLQVNGMNKRKSNISQGHKTSAQWDRNLNFVAVVQSLSRVQLFVTPWTAACQASLSITNS